jgi:ATP-dependent DNA helicase Q1
VLRSKAIDLRLEVWFSYRMETSDTSASEKLKLSLKKCKKELQLTNKLINDYEKKIRPLKLRRDELMNQINTCNNELKLLPTSVPGEFSKEFSWDIEIQEALKNIFNINSFRVHQKEAINAVLSKKDVFVVKPTGGGKSLIFQAPAVIEEGFTLVISPLVSLSHDQSLHLRDLGINAKVLDASTTKEEVKNIYKEMIIDNKSRDIDYNLEMMKILYVTPEKIISSKRFFQKLQQAAKLKNLTRIVIDEAHCVSGWGCDFRPAYRQLDLLRTSKDVDEVPILALTATATRNVQNDVQNILKMKHTELFLGSFNRMNLFYSVQEKPANNNEFVSAVVNEINICKRKFNHNIDPCGIIYVHSRGDADKLSKILNDKHNLRTLPYHAGLEHHDKKRAHESWRNDVTKIIVATVAFGM